MSSSWQTGNIARMQAALEALQGTAYTKNETAKRRFAAVTGAGADILGALEGRTDRKFKTSERLGGEEQQRELERQRLGGTRELEAQRSANQRTLDEESAAREATIRREEMASREREATIRAGADKDKEARGKILQLGTQFFAIHKDLAGYAKGDLDAAITAYVNAAITSEGLDERQARDLERYIRSMLIGKAPTPPTTGGAPPPSRVGAADIAGFIDSLYKGTPGAPVARAIAGSVAQVRQMGEGARGEVSSLLEGYQGLFGVKQTPIDAAQRQDIAGILAVLEKSVPRGAIQDRAQIGGIRDDIANDTISGESLKRLAELIETYRIAPPPRTERERMEILK